MLEIFVLLSAILVSLIYLGVPRTAIWLVGHLVIRPITPIAPAAILCGLSVFASLATYQSQAFDFRSFEKSKVYLALFLSSVLSGALVTTPAQFSFTSACVFLIVSSLLFKVFRFPLAHIYFLSRSRTLILLWSLVLISVALRLLENPWAL